MAQREIERQRDAGALKPGGPGGGRARGGAAGTGSGKPGGARASGVAEAHGASAGPPAPGKPGGARANGVADVDGESGGPRTEAAVKPGGARNKSGADGGGVSVGPHAGAALTPHEQRAAVRYAPNDVQGEPVCLHSLRRGGCRYHRLRTCKRGSHDPPIAPELRPEVELWLVQHGGPRERQGAPLSVVTADEAGAEAARWRAMIRAQDDERLLDGPMRGVRESTHPLEQPLVADLVDKTDVLSGAVKAAPTLLWGTDRPDSAQMTMTRAARAALVEAFPELDQCDANHQALLYRHAVSAVQSGVPLTAPTALLQAGLPYLRKSTLPGAREAAQRLQPPSTSAGGGPASMLLTSGARARDGKGNPLAVLFPRDAHGQSPLLLGGESWLAQDRGQNIADLGSQCVLLVLAHALEVEPADLHARGVVEAEALLQALGSLHDSLSLEELGARQCAHDFLHRSDHDFFLTRYFFRNAVAPQSSSAWVLRKGSCASR